MTTSNSPGAVIDRAHPLTRGLIAAWNFGERAGSVARDSLSQYAATANGTVTWSGGAFGGAALFDGTSTYFDAGNSSVFNPTSGMSIVVVARQRATAGEGWLLGRDQSGGRSYAFGVTTYGTGELELQINGAATIRGQGQVPQLNRWYQFAATGDSGDGWKVWLDGVVQGTASWSAPTATSTSTNIGRRSYVGNYGYWPGAIASVRIYSRRLSGSELHELWNDPDAGMRARPISRIFTGVALETSYVFGVISGGAISDFPASTGVYVEEGTASGAWTASGSDVTADIDAGAASGAWTASGSDVVAISETGAASGAWTASGDDVYGYAESGTASGAWVASADDVSADIDAGAASGAWTASGSDVITADDIGAASGAWTASASDFIALIEAGSASGDWTASGDELAAALETGTASGAWVASADDVTASDETGAASGAWAASADDVTAFDDTGTASGDWVASASDFIALIEAGATSGDWTASGDDVYAPGSSSYVEEGTASGAWVASGDDVFVGEEPEPEPGGWSNWQPNYHTRFLINRIKRFREDEEILVL